MSCRRSRADDEDIVKALRDCDGGFLREDHNFSRAPPPFSGWYPGRVCARPSAVVKRDALERPRAQEAIARKLHRLYRQATSDSHNWKAIVDKKTYKYVADNGFYRKTKLRDSDVADRGCNLSNTCVEAKLRKNIPQSWRKTDLNQLPSLTDNFAVNAAWTDCGVPTAADDESKALQSLLSSLSAIALGNSADLAPDGVFENGSNLENNNTADGVASSASSLAELPLRRGGGDGAAYPQICDSTSRLSLRLPELELYGPSKGARVPDEASASFTLSATFSDVLGIDQRLHVLDAELSRDLGIFDGETSWLSMFDHLPANNNFKRTPSSNADISWIMQPSKNRKSKATLPRQSGRHCRRFSKLRYVTRGGEVVFVPIYGCPLPMQNASPTGGTGKRTAHGARSPPPPAAGVGTSRAVWPEVEGIKYRLTAKRGPSEVSFANCLSRMNLPFASGEDSKGVYFHQ